MKQATHSPQETIPIETTYCFYCAEQAIGLDGQHKPTCGGCEGVVFPLPEIVPQQT